MGRKRRPEDGLWRKLGGRRRVSWAMEEECGSDVDSERCSLKRGPHEGGVGWKCGKSVEGHWTVGLLTLLWLLPSHGGCCL